ncbi:MAG: zinc-binding dehydrogenase [Acidimicrobiia bacterium]|nr:zinc-binding dehydrogenase [Acidimicrobiia bacterium]MDX2467892.1 zinc-binding dehydrogenase [Acidimicrobiia bacterium]
MLSHGAGDRALPVIAEQFPLLEASRAHEFMETGGQAGKVVLTVGG